MYKIFLFLFLLTSPILACEKCSLFVFQKYKEFCLSKCSMTETEILSMPDKDIPEEALEYFYMGQICAYENCIEDVKYRLIDYPTCGRKK